MPKVTLEAHADIALLRLNNGVINAISPELIGDLTVELERIRNEFRGMVLAGGDKFFCIGLDLPGLLQLGRAEMMDFYVALAATYAQSGQQKDAVRAAKTVLQLNPFFEVDSYGTAFRKPADRAKIMDGLRKAGLK